MTNKEFQYEIQSHQEDCIKNIIDIFNALKRHQPLPDVMRRHYVGNNHDFPIRDTRNIDIMMGTGTGKTFIFIKTMFELNREFDFKKFIVLVPSVSIREGLKTNLEDTAGYFRRCYSNRREKKIEPFIYEKGQIKVVDRFIKTDHLSVLVMTPNSFDKRNNILNRPPENEVHLPHIQNMEPPESYLDVLKRLDPIIIIDEPHRFDGDAFKKYFEGFDNYYLRFGATFPKRESEKASSSKDTVPLSNVAYTLDSISSFRQNLVKRITVTKKDVPGSEDSLVKVENKKAFVDTLNNGSVKRRELVEGDTYNGKIIVKINNGKKSILLKDGEIVRVDYNLSDDALRLMIKETVKIHFEKEKMLFDQGIKALTLFFIESDKELYRGENPKIKKIFEEEYKEERKRKIEEYGDTPDDPYCEYLRNDFDSNGDLRVNEGYFSGDKGTNDERIKTGIDEILTKKKELLSFESPIRFIFSIWALREGWDNPNVFTICKLSNQGSDNSKLQQIGRGLRICVNQDLKRLTIGEFDGNRDAFWEVNDLDVVVSNHESDFVETIQNEISSNSFIPSTFKEEDLIKKLKEKTSFNDDEIVCLVDDILKKEKMIVLKRIDDEGQRIYEKSPDYSFLLGRTECSDGQRKALENLFPADDLKENVRWKNEVKPKQRVVIKERHLDEFRNLWNIIHKNAFYTIDNLDKKSEKGLITKIKKEIEKLNIDEILLRTVRCELKADKDGIKFETKHENAISFKSKFDCLSFVKELSSETKTPFSFIVEIFNALSPEFRNKVLTNNPARALKEMTKIVRDNLVETIKTKIHYDGIEGSISPDVFSKEFGKYSPGSTGKHQKDIKDIHEGFSLKEKWIFKDVIEYDSDFELGIIEKDPDKGAIEIFGKLPKLKIPTPLGEYSPDFCYVVKDDKGDKRFLIVESKGYELSGNIPPDERTKIDFAKKYFEDLKNYYEKRDGNVKVLFKERIKSTELCDLIHTLLAV